MLTECTSSTAEVRWSWIAVFSIALFVFLRYVTESAAVPIVPDEVGYLAIAKYLAIGQALNLAETSNYSFGHPLLLIPAFWFSRDASTIYQIGVAISCLATALVPLAMVGIATNSGLPRSLFLIASAFLVAVFPAYIYHSALVWSEATFRLAFLLVLLVFAWAWRSGKTWRWLLFAASVMALYAIHARALGVIPVAVVTLMVARAMQKATWTGVFAAATLMAACWLGIHEINNHLEVAIWGGSVSESGKIGDFLGVLTTLPGLKSAVAVSLGQFWSLLASSLGFFGIGLYAGWQITKVNPTVRPLIAFATIALLAVGAASVLQMMQPSRIDHVIYGRYLDGASTIVVWLGLLWLGQHEKRAGAVALNASLIAVSALATLKPFIHAPLSPVVTPNISGLLWIDNTGIAIGTASLLTIMVMGSLVALAVSSSALAMSSRPWLALCSVATIAAATSASALWQQDQAHMGRAGYVQISTAAYAKAAGRPVHWDVSAASNGNTMIDQFAAASGAMQPSNIAEEDIPIDDAAVVADTFEKNGYALLGDLPDETKLVVKSR
ncbi:hypothetical protein FJW07_14165 [Mesorhizobium sp. B3-1-9]|uniref:hypothetical protein n=1 Tax=Mesorhizobium sp. B3-1-9 TaxID=2589892 RepID=UPI00112BB703|nr:hypothetical protein [Mesorhizobium sp. B3-1-9]TPI39318.1 hypothetical protein FJW07_14165 [Mesorhizobium sp. B3-1-9]